MRTSRQMLRQVRRALLVAFLFSGCVNVLMLATPLYTLQVFETVVPLGSIETLVILTLITGAAILALAVIEIARDMVLLRAGLWLDHQLGQHILENGVRLGQPGSELRQDARALDQLRATLTSSVIAPLFDAPFVPVFIGVLFVLHPAIGGVALASAVLLLLAVIAQAAFTGRVQQEASKAHERAQMWWMTVAGNAQLAGALGLAHGAASQWEGYNRAHVAGAYSAGKRTSIVKAGARLVRIASQVALYGLGAWLVVRSELSPGALVASAILLARALAPLEQLVGTVKATEAALAAYRRLRALPPDAKAPRLANDMARLPGHLVLRDVTVFHPGRKMAALRNVSLEIKPGQALGIVGPNGSGKSTLAAVLAGALSPSSGLAELDGLPVARWQRGEGSPPVGYLPDEPALVEGSVHENIARFTDASLLSAAQAAMQAGVHDALSSLPEGYETQVGPSGSALALRERRAVSLARALHGGPRLVVLDEPECGLDGAGLRHLMAVLKRLKSEGVGLAIATQDPRLLALTDQTVVLNSGLVQTLGASQDLTGRLAPVRQQPEAVRAAGVH